MNRLVCSKGHENVMKAYGDIEDKAKYEKIIMFNYLVYLLITT